MIVYELIVGLNCGKCKSRYIWCTDGSFVSPSEFKSSGKIAYGYAINNRTVVSLRRSTSRLDWKEAEFYCTKCNNGGKLGHLPCKDWLSLLHFSIMSGKMKEDLIEAGLYEECNYKVTSDYLSESNWHYVWSSDEYNHNNAYYMYYSGNTYISYKLNCYHAIPFFKF